MEDSPLADNINPNINHYIEETEQVNDFIWKLNLRPKISICASKLTCQMLLMRYKN